MSTEYIVHPLAVRIHQDPNFFNVPQPDIHCLHCNNTSATNPLVPIPVRHKDTKLGSAHTRESKFITHDTMHVHHLYCLHCAQLLGSEHAPHLQNLFLAQYYNFGTKFLDIRPALPFWVLNPFGGPLNYAQYDQWNKSGEITGIETGSVTAWREMVMILKLQNKYYNFRFNKNDKFWFTAQRSDTTLCCWNCYESLANLMPVPAVIDYNTETQDAFECNGFFCSAPCRMSYVLRKDGQLAKQRIFWNSTFYSIQFEHGRPVVDQKAPSRRLLKRFGGFLSAEEYRSELNVYQRVREPPIQDFPFYASKSPLVDGKLMISNEVHHWSVLNFMKTPPTLVVGKFQNVPTTFQPHIEFASACVLYFKFYAKCSNWTELEMIERFVVLNPGNYNTESWDHLSSEFILENTEQTFMEMSKAYITCHMEMDDTDQFDNFHNKLLHISSDIEKTHQIKLTEQHLLSKFVSSLGEPLMQYVNCKNPVSLVHAVKLSKLFHSKLSLKMNGDEYNLGTQYFEKKFHSINGNEQFKLSFQLMVIEYESQDTMSNEELLKYMINKPSLY